MKNNKLDQIWDSQTKHSVSIPPKFIIKKAKKQRREQFISILVMSITVGILIVYAVYYALGNWSNFTLGLVLMISSLAFRILLEFFSLYKKENQLISLDSLSFQDYLRKHYRLRLKVNYFITPLCFAIYVYGFLKLLPYFKQEFSNGFYNYIVISGFVSLFIIVLIIINSVLKESKFLKGIE